MQEFSERKFKTFQGKENTLPVDNNFKLIEQVSFLSNGIELDADWSHLIAVPAKVDHD